MDNADIDKNIDVSKLSTAMGLINRIMKDACDLKILNVCSKEYMEQMSKFILASGYECNRLAVRSDIVPEAAINEMSEMLDEFENKINKEEK